jgi:2-polyprenyl-3-methyl-5-hydroxy-6-metoxy-1,4-benzoquinol methylase
MRDLSIKDEVLEKTFHFLRRFKPVRERVTLGERDDHVEREHVARYEFAKFLCKGKKVADIACGTGYGMQILGTVALSVEGYDKECLCRNTVIDLDRESWTKSYDVIVSFETIEHLAHPDFFLKNAARTAQQLVVSTPIGEFRGYNPHHKQVWSFEQFRSLLERYFDADYFFQRGEAVENRPVHPIRFVVAVCKPKPDDDSLQKTS